MTKLRKAGGNWVEGDRFFDREAELEALGERAREGTHTLLTAQRRMGKTSLVREVQRRLGETGEFETVFVDLEAAADPADAVAEIAVQARPLQGAWRGIMTGFRNVLREAGERIEELAIADMRVRLRAGVDAGNWPQKGDAVLEALATSGRPVVLALDELPILVNRLLKDDGDLVTPAGRRAADEFQSWLRKTGQAHRGRISIVLSGSVGLERLLEQAGLSAHANIFSPFDLKPWSEETAVSCLAALADTYRINLSREVRGDMCRRMRCCIPHHVQMFFDRMHEHLRHAGRSEAAPEDVEWAYRHEMLSVRGQMDLQHYEGRLEMVLGREGYPIALELLTETALNGPLDDEDIGRYRDFFAARGADRATGAPSLEDVLRILRHDGYLEWEGGGLRFVSGLLEDWWSGRHGQNFVPVTGPRPHDAVTAR